MDMTAADPNLGVAAASAKPQAATNFAPAPATPGVAAVWPRSAQIALAALLGLAVGLLAWNSAGMMRWGSRPTELDTSTASFAKLDLNRADRPQLLQLPGVGDNLARRIEAYRLDHHGFHDVDDLRHVSGIGPTMLERLRPFVYVERLEVDEEDQPPTRISFYSPPATMPARSPAMTPAEKKTTAKKTDGLKAPVNVNEATAAELQHLPGVGPKMADRIIEARDKKPFRKVDDLRQVSGIGAKTLENLRPFVTVDPSAKVETNP